MELAIAIWKDCKRLLTDNQSITCDRLQPFANINVHVEKTACSSRNSRALFVRYQIILYLCRNKLSQIIPR